MQPQIRFDGFSEKWKEDQLSSLGHIQTGSTPPTSNEQNYSSEGLLWVTPTDISSPIVKKTNRRLSKEGEKVARIVPKDTILVTCIASIGKNALLTESGSFNQQINSLTPNTGLNPYFLYSQSYFWSEKMKKIAGQGTMQIVNKTQFSAIETLIPNCENEQEKIGDFFQSIDHNITLQQEKLKKIQALKKAMLEKMFPKSGSKQPEIRLNGFSGDWEQLELGNQVEFYSGLTYSPNNVVKAEGTLVLRSSNVQNNEIFLGDNVYVCSNVVNSFNVEKGDVIVVVRNGSRNLIGKHAIIKKVMEKTVIGAFMTGIRSDLPFFLNALLDTQQFISEINKSLGATINQITLGNFKKMLFFFPADSNEQEKIGNYFKELDNAIALQAEQLEKLKNIKKAYLNKMFV